MAAGMAALAGGCGNERCDQVTDFYEAKCFKDATMKFTVDGQPGQLKSDDEAKRECAAKRSRTLEWCKKAPEEVLACDMSAAKDLAAWRKDQRCQDILETYYKQTHPGEK